jgi:hypothetical protein
MRWFGDLFEGKRPRPTRLSTQINTLTNLPLTRQHRPQWHRLHAFAHGVAVQAGVHHIQRVQLQVVHGDAHAFGDGGGIGAFKLL